MSIRVLFFATFAEITGNHEFAIDAGGLSTIGDIFSNFAKQFPALEMHRKSILLAVNSEFADPKTPVHDGDEVAFFPPVSGG